MCQIDYQKYGNVSLVQITIEKKEAIFVITYHPSLVQDFTHVRLLFDLSLDEPSQEDICRVIALGKSHIDQIVDHFTRGLLFPVRIFDSGDGRIPLLRGLCDQIQLYFTISVVNVFVDLKGVFPFFFILMPRPVGEPVQVL